MIFILLLSDQLKPCSTYMISVKTWTSENLFGQSTPIKIVTKDTVPLAPSNLHVEETSQHGFVVRWCAPNQDPQCSRVWDWNTYENVPLEPHQPIWGTDDYEYEFFNENCKVVEEGQLKCDSVYRFTAWAYSPSGLEGEKAEIDIKTKYC